MNETVLAVFSAVLGAVIGSFLNACIHRMPRGIPLSNPRRSFCPSCQRSIPWYENLPVVSWILLRGRCRGCGAPISIRYLVVEAITAAAFFFAWQRFGLPLAPAYWVFLALLIAATFIDIEHFIIPDEITWGGTLLGLALSPILPELMATSSRGMAFLRSLGGAALGFGLLWGIVELGKLAFGKKRHKFESAEAFTWQREGEKITLQIGEESLPWEDIFSRESDELVMECEACVIDGRESAEKILRFRHNSLTLGGEKKSLEDFTAISGRAPAVTIPREAMGFGDVKFIAAIGAFLGWQAVIFSIAAASIVGSMAALAGILLARDRSGARVPFGPFLALGAALWLFGGNVFWEWYFSHFQGPDPGWSDF